MRAKYIVGLMLDDINNRRLEAVVFSTSARHDVIADAFGFGNNVVSAGFFEIDKSDVIVLGGVYLGSESLGIGPQDFDVKYIKLALGLCDPEPMPEEEQMWDYQKGLQVIKENNKKEKNHH